MTYSYDVEKQHLFTERGTQMLLQVRDRVKHLLEIAGAFRQSEALNTISGDSWQQMAALDYLVEKGEIICVRHDCWSQYRVFCRPEKRS